MDKEQYKKKLWAHIVLMFMALIVVACSDNDSNSGNMDEGVNTSAEDPVKNSGNTYDLIIKNGRVIDPETGRDEIACVAIKDGVIQKITMDPTFDTEAAEHTIDATDLVVSPGFINTHTHEGMQKDIKGIESIPGCTMFYVLDGITFWLGGNCGASPTGVNIPIDDTSAVVWGDADQPLSTFMDEVDTIPLYNNFGTLSGNLTLRSNVGCKHMDNETDDQIQEMKTILAKDLETGAFGVSFGVMYDMGTSKKAMIELSQTSKDVGGMAASHIRYPLFNLKHILLGINAIMFKDALIEAIDTCRDTQVPFIVSHITDMTQADSAKWAFQTLDNAIREERLPLAGDIIGHDFLGNDAYVLTFKGEVPVTVMFALGNYKAEQFYAGRDIYINGDLIFEKYGQMTLLQLEYLRMNFDKIDGFEEGNLEVPVICQIIPPEDTMMALQYPWVFIGNDAGVGIDTKTGEPKTNSPRALGTFSQLLGRWSRDQGAISLQQALFKATIAPARWLGLDKKGRLQEGCDADITLFNPDTIIHRAEWLEYKEHLKPEGIPYVIVNGKIVVENGELTGNTPGRLIRRTWDIPGDTTDLLSLYESIF